jgi:hypothetical protein
MALSPEHAARVQASRERFQTLWAQHGLEWADADYANAMGITTGRVGQLRRALGIQGRPREWAGSRYQIQTTTTEDNRTDPVRIICGCSEVYDGPTYEALDAVRQCRARHPVAA